MHRVLLCLALAAASAPAGSEGVAMCDGPRGPLDGEQFRQVLETVADAWNRNQPDRAVACFTDNAVYMEPPDRQLYQSAAALHKFFAESLAPAQHDRMRWHATAFDERRQLGFGEYTYRGRQNYHGVAVLQIERGRIRSWREYQQGSGLSWERFIGPSR